MKTFYRQYLHENSNRKENAIARIRKGLEKLEFKLNPTTTREGLLYITANIWPKRIINPVFVKKTKDTIAFIRSGKETAKSIIISFKGKSPQLYKRAYFKESKTTNVRRISIESFHYQSHCNIFANAFQERNSDLIIPKLDKFLINLVNEYAQLKYKTNDFEDYLYHLFYKGSFVFPIPIKKFPETFLPYLRHEDNVNNLIKKFFGYNSKSIRKVFFSQLSILLNSSTKFDNKEEIKNSWILANCFKKKIPIDYIRQILEASIMLPMHPECTKKEFKTLKSFAHFFIGREKRLLKLLDLKTNNYCYRSNLLTDTLHNLKILIENNPHYDLFKNDFSTLNELHDVVARNARKIKDKPFLIYQKSLHKINGAKINENIQLTLPTTNHDLVNWADELNNCLAGYVNNVKENFSQIIGVLVDQQLTYAIEVNPITKEVRQFYGKCNTQPKQEHRKIVETYLTDQKIIKQYYPHWPAPQKVDMI